MAALTVHRAHPQRSLPAARAARPAAAPLTAEALVPAALGRAVEPAAPAVAARPRGEAGVAALALAAERLLDLSADGGRTPVDRVAASEASVAYRNQGAAPALDRPRPLVLSIRI